MFDTEPSDSAGAVGQLAPCARRDHSLSETEPFLVSSLAHEGPREAHFDMHYALELGVVLSGSMNRLYAGHERVIEPGQVWLCSSWEPHGFRLVAGSCHAIVVSIFPPTLAQSHFPELAQLDWHEPFLAPAAHRAEIEPAERAGVLRLGEELRDSVSLPTRERLLTQRMLVYRVLLGLCGRAAPHALEPMTDEGWPHFNRAIELVWRKRCFVSTDEAARECGVSEKALNAFFRRAAGVSFPKFAHRCRLQGAASQLLSTKDPVKAIGQDWGFTDVSHFHAAFRASYGCSPVRYRERRGAQALPT